MKLLNTNDALLVSGGGEAEVDGAIGAAIGTYVHCVMSQDAKDGFASGGFIGAIAGAINHYNDDH